MSNCLFFAVLLYMRRHRKGFEGYLVVRRSRWGPFPHVLYAEMRPGSCSLRVVGYVPRAPRRKPIPPIMFHGNSNWGDLNTPE